MWKRPIRTDPADGVALLLRIVSGSVLFPHGAQKLFGWFGGNGFAGTIGYMTGSQGLPWIIGFLVIMIETVGAVMLFFGFLSRLAASGVLAVMIGAVLKVHLHYGFFMNWTGQKAGEGMEYHLLAAGIALAIMLRGGGRFSVDSQLQKPESRRTGRYA
jgi:putative oxidoreductase